MLAVVVLFTLALYGLISNIADGLAAVDESCGYLSGGDVSTCELNRNNTAALALSIWLAVGASGMTSLIAVFHVMTARVSFLMSFACSLLPIGVLALSKFDEGRTPFHISSFVLTLSAIAAVSATTVIFGLEFMITQDSDAGNYLERLASKRAAQYLKDGTEYKGMPLKKKLVIGVLGALPCQFILGVLFMYLTVIFNLFAVYDTDQWKVLVTLVAFAMKVAGNKGLLKIAAAGRPWLTDFNLFTYEFVTATLLRVLQVSWGGERVCAVRNDRSERAARNDRRETGSKRATLNVTIRSHHRPICSHVCVAAAVHPERARRAAHVPVLRRRRGVRAPFLLQPLRGDGDEDEPQGHDRRAAV